MVWLGLVARDYCRIHSFGKVLDVDNHIKLWLGRIDS